MTDKLAAQLEDVIRLAASMPDPHHTWSPVHAADPSRPVTGSPSKPDTLPFGLSHTLDYWDTPPADPTGIRSRTGLNQWATAWAVAWWTWRDTPNEPKPTSQPLLWLHANLPWAEISYPAMDQFAAELNTVHYILQQACGLTPIPTDRHCPTCGQTLVHPVTARGVADVYHCEDCDNDWTAQGIAEYQRLRILAAAPYVTRDQAAHLLHISRHRIRVWINRHQLHPRPDGTIPLADAYHLATTPPDTQKPR
ncbi:helix-turn-helix domain-containing protein [Actinobaculum sp. 352]|uniref:helix-turn-helix domain-containing protein n=1 Tax=Actinobaculum sp. 352 TaxID=2490946 RepID=UPI000F7D6D90|nr:helix-turn-helix domain-containing protein [Actinobaculum sp. 352]RTE49626.1 DNA-binding protein [Actinobaculum sp. 352]